MRSGRGPSRSRLQEGVRVHPESGLCIGCLRTVDEIAAWPAMAPDARRALMAELPGREGRLARRRGGARGAPGPVIRRRRPGARP
jgi:predicted Fe-S protein YdhL (DUF1289 family)